MLAPSGFDGESSPRQSRPELPLYRLYVLRASYLLIGLAQGSKTWPAILHRTQQWDFWHGVGMSFFGALTLTARGDRWR